MADTLRHLAGTPVLICAPDGAPLRGERDATDLVGDAYSHGAAWIACPVERLTGEFFQLSTGIAGGIVQKFATYQLGFAVIGDVSHHTAASSALRDFVRESNRGTQLWFVADTDALLARLARR
ncbi:DUF4180 domain-containing protein [Marinitenerispora sediminis]|uniref:DUF4180 domain-containing protein n=1 Tax=Marinitenerispora sediminis TaxID=1931232 RepID=A0A368T0F3_9ACTN|nr:DUF4180 domain-containing protein [Marinitenerispora sediminis]RCV51001.1 DUF4180 domain-containing protein [Marinitenerispora sediminis]RCV52238.1 DUF4180 domain-containing protein [Marinitenerispora sediminis]RCV53846.1 DUF4180 domain-containing protein [Marinitenerispora sediminis]